MNCEAPLYQNCLLRLPRDVFLEGIVGYLRPRDLQQLDTAFTNRRQRPILRNLWKSYHYSTPDGLYNLSISLSDLKWLVKIGANITGVTVDLSCLGSDPIKFDVFPNLKIFKTKRFYYFPTLTFTEWPFVQLARGSPHLEVLSIDGGSCASDAGIMALVQHCPKLHTISLGRFYNMPHSCIFAICERCPLIQHVSLHCENSCSDDAFMAILKAYPHLKSLRLNKLLHVDNVLAIAKYCNELENVAFRFSADYDDSKNTGAAITALGAANPHLIDIDISQSLLITDADIISLAQCCPKLESVNIFACLKISDVSVFALAEHCPNLTALNIGCCRKITDAALIALAEHCPNLAELSVGCCRKITDAALLALGSHTHCLRSLNIGGNKNLTVDGVTALAAGCPLLQEVNAYDSCFDLARVIALVSGCHDLRKLDISRCNGIDLSAILAIAHNCPLITWLNLSCTDVDDACLLAIAEHCRYLTILSACCGFKYSSATFDALVKACPLEEFDI